MLWRDLHSYILALRASKHGSQVVSLCLEVQTQENKTQRQIRGFPAWIFHLGTHFSGWWDIGVVDIWNNSLLPCKPHVLPTDRGVVFLQSLQDKHIRKHLNNSSEWCIHNVTSIKQRKTVSLQEARGLLHSPATRQPLAQRRCSDSS